MTGLDASTIIAVISLLTGLGIIFQLMLGPIRRDITRLEGDIKELKLGQTEILAKLSKLTPQ